jgi:hypothetical protein
VSVGVAPLFGFSRFCCWSSCPLLSAIFPHGFLLAFLHSGASRCCVRSLLSPVMLRRAMKALCCCFLCVCVWCVRLTGLLTPCCLGWLCLESSSDNRATRRRLKVRQVFYGKRGAGAPFSLTLLFVCLFWYFFCDRLDPPPPPCCGVRPFFAWRVCV